MGPETLILNAFKIRVQVGWLRTGQPTLPASRRVFQTPRDTSLKGKTVLVCGLAHIGVEAVITDAQREVVGDALLVLLLPDAAALDQPTLRGAADDAVRGGHRVRARDGFDGDSEVGGQGRYAAEAFSGFDVDACETDST